MLQHQRQGQGRAQNKEHGVTAQTTMEDQGAAANAPLTPPVPTELDHLS